jgi:hypothetical protein
MTVARTDVASHDGQTSGSGAGRDFLLNVVDRLVSSRQGTPGHAGSFLLSPSEVAILCKAARCVGGPWEVLRHPSFEAVA